MAEAQATAREVKAGGIFSNLGGSWWQLGK